MKKDTTSYFLYFVSLFCIGMLLFILLSLAVYPNETLKMGGDLVHKIKEVMK